MTLGRVGGVAWTREVEGQGLNGRRARARDSDRGVAFEIDNIRFGKTAHAIDLARAELSFRRIDRRDEANDHAVEQRTAGVAVVRIALGDHVVAGDVLRDAEWTGA